MNKNDLITTRLMNPNDKNFILATFLRGLFYGESWFSLIKKDIFMHNYHSIVEKLLSSDNNYVKVACLKDDPEVILGYAILSKDDQVLHWAFVKKSWRSIGIFKALAPSTVKTVTHLTKAGLGMLKKHPEVDF